jgi:hypothetical protein
LGAQADAPGAEFTKALIAPKFEVKETPQILVLENKFMRYTIGVGPTVDADVRRRFYAYDRLNAYHKSKQPGQLPPFPQVAVTSEMEARALLPNAIEVEFTTMQGTQAFSAHYELEFLEENAVSDLRRTLLAVGMAP